MDDQEFPVLPERLFPGKLTQEQIEQVLQEVAIGELIKTTESKLGVVGEIKYPEQIKDNTDQIKFLEEAAKKTAFLKVIDELMSGNYNVKVEQPKHGPLDMWTWACRVKILFTAKTPDDAKVGQYLTKDWVGPEVIFNIFKYNGYQVMKIGWKLFVREHYQREFIHDDWWRIK